MAPEGERGSVLLLMPAAMLVMVVLAAIAVDASVAFLGQRELANASAAAANDAATAALSERAFYVENRLEIDPAAADSIARQRLAVALDPARFHDVAVVVTVTPQAGPCPPTVTVTTSARVPYVFAKALPGRSHDADVHASSLARPQQAADVGC